ncbi:alpha/beta fold hydrolase [Acetivibrio cellulolyticus]|uniref:alpha/beta fold hydrolase n=1 Tax=Acetivibrio cellulolyticus TaxID=35830 RepID=UPI0001E2FBCE|nr:alpha/beta hydrolase [Acetivibrio cellulolyticus]
MKKALRIIGISVLLIIIIAIVVFAVYSYRNLHWYDKYEKSIEKAGAVETQVTLPNGNAINYGEVKNDKPALLLIHGQMGAWEDYALLLPELSENWHVYAIDVYGHGQSSHNESLYYLDVNGDDLIWFIDNVIGEKTVVSGHSNGALTAAYIAAYGGDNIVGVILEDPPVFSTEGEGWKTSFAYLDTYKPLHDYNSSEQTECWEAYYLRNCYWGQLYMADSMDGIANYAQKYHEKHPDEEVKIFFMPSSAVSIFHYVVDYDFAYGEHFYDLSWNNGYTHKEIFENIDVPCIYLHAKENAADTGVYLCAASREQAERAVEYIGPNCELRETSDSSHVIHSVHRDIYLEAVNSMVELFPTE